LNNSRDSFAARIVRWQRRHGRHDLPWQGTRDAYRIWLSEVMLQQTQVASAIPYFERFVARFPDVRTLAAAREDDVLALWSGLGYYARARNLHRAAKEVMARFDGRFPVRFEDVLDLPGVGRSTAAAIVAFATGEPHAILDGNVKRVLARHAGIGGDPSSTAVVAKLWEAAEARLPRRGIEPYTQGLMDLGATVCVRTPDCDACPVAADCVARIEDRIAQLPGRRKRAAPKRKRTAMLAIIANGEVLLEKRPPTGIWGGLWSLPEAPARSAPAEFARREWGLEVARAQKLEPFEHAFSHFTLEVTPWLVHLKRGTRIAGERVAMWLALSEASTAALPAPVKVLLVALSRSAFAASGTGAAPRAARRRR
jgi:A/G-specific adenine glycosylase